MTNILLLFIPLSLTLRYLFQASPIWVFLSAIFGIIPLSIWIQRCTEQIAIRTGPAVGGLLNVTFGNATELILAVFVLASGNAAVVKGQITGSIIGNSLLGLGLVILVGTWRKSRLTFDRAHAGLLTNLLILIVIGLLLPALFSYAEQSLVPASQSGVLVERLSLGIAVVLLLLYIANLIFTLHTHGDVFEVEVVEPGEKTWPLWRTIGILAAATLITAFEAELVSGALEKAALQIGVSSYFLGVIVLASVGNFSEYISAIIFGKQGKMDMALSITVGSSIQVGLFVAPILVLVSFIIGHPMNLVFNNLLEMFSITAVVFAVNAIAQDGETTWFEGALLIGVYLMLGLAFLFVIPK